MAYSRAAENKKYEAFRKALERWCNAFGVRVAESSHDPDGGFLIESVNNGMSYYRLAKVLGRGTTTAPLGDTGLTPKELVARMDFAVASAKVSGLAVKVGK